MDLNAFDMEFAKFDLMETVDMTADATDSDSDPMVGGCWHGKFHLPSIMETTH
jgi:hypothetical protein